MSLVTLADGNPFEADADEPLLAAALRAGLPVPHGCRNGRCGSCKARLLEGSTLPLVAEDGLDEAERAAGWLLTCARSAGTGLRLDWPLRNRPQLPPARTVPCRIDRLQPLSADVLQVTLRLPPRQPLAVLPGQHVEVAAPDGTRRSYSVANAPLPGRELTQVELHLRRVPGGAMSRWWFGQARVDDLLRLHGPLGGFVLGDVTAADVLLLATGTGIAPIKALLEQISHLPPAELPRTVALFWGGRTAADLYWDPRSIVLPVPWRFTPVLSRAAPRWDGERGYVQGAALAALQADVTGPDFARLRVFACGSAAMVDSARRAFAAAGLGSDRFHADAFVCSAPAATHALPT